MKKQLKLKNELVLFVLCLTLFGCQDLFESRNEDNESRAEQISNAQTWYEANKPDPISLRSGNDESLLMKPYWSHSSTKKNDRYRTVETALLMKGRISFLDKECFDLYEQTKDERYNQSLTQLVVLTDLELDQTIGFLMTIIPNLDYLLETDYKPFRNISYLERNDRFGGKILYHDLDGHFVCGWEYVKGKITHTISGGADVDTPVELRASTCTSVPIYQNVTVCSDYSYTVECGDSGEMYHSQIICNNVTITTGYYWNCQYCGGGGGGGYPGGGASCSASSTPYLYKIYASGTLTSTQQKMLETLIVNMRRENPIFKAIYEYMANNGHKLGFSINPGAAGRGTFDVQGYISFRTEADIDDFEVFFEEMVHAVQYYQFYGNNMKNSFRNYEFEAKVALDIACAWGYLGGCAYYGNQTMTLTDAQAYTAWIDGFRDRNRFTASDQNMLNYFCGRWPEKGMNNTGFIPEVLLKYFYK